MSSTEQPQPWHPKAIADIDEALTVYATHRDELNRDGQAEARARHVDEMLDQRHAYTEAAKAKG